MRWCLVATLASLACRPGTKPETDAPSFERAYDPSSISPGTRVFLVAGGDDVANFGAEVVAQRRLWRDAGVPDERIACYWAAPTDAAYLEDLEQYRNIIPALRSCHRASPDRVLGDLHAIAARAPPWIYVYVSAHGIDSLLGLARTADDRKLQRLVSGLSRDERETLDIAAIGLQAGPAPKLQEVSAVIEGLRDGTKPRELMLTPETLGEALAAFPASTRKTVVLQACFSGGFIGHPPRDDDRPQPLSGIANLVAMTATASDRPSFGCDAGSHFTHFGGAFLHALARELDTPRDGPEVVDGLRWDRIFDRCAFAVEVMEAVDDERPSRPGFFSTSEG